MNERIKRIWNDHKVKIFVVGGTIFAVTLCVLGAKKKISLRKPVDVLPSSVNNVEIPTDFNVGKIVDLWKEGKYLNAIVDNVTVKDLGCLGEEFIKRGLVSEEADVTAVIGFN